MSVSRVQKPVRELATSGNEAGVQSRSKCVYIIPFRLQILTCLNLRAALFQRGLDRSAPDGRQQAQCASFSIQLDLKNQISKTTGIRFRWQAQREYMRPSLSKAAPATRKRFHLVFVSSSGPTAPSTFNETIITDTSPEATRGSPVTHYM